MSWNCCSKKLFIKLIHRYAFLTGLLSDMIFFNTDYWRKSNLDETLMTRLAKANSQIAQNVAMPMQNSIRHSKSCC